MSIDRASVSNAEFESRSKGLMNEFLEFVKTDKKLKNIAVGVFAVASGPAYSLLASGRFTELSGSLLAAGATFVGAYAASALYGAYAASLNKAHPDDLLDEKNFLTEREAMALFLRKQTHLEAFGENVLDGKDTTKINQELIDRGVASIQELAGHGEAKAQFFLARLHLAGTFVEKDFEVAKVLLEKSSNKGQPDALYALSQLYLRGQGGLEKDNAKGLALLEMACEKGGARAISDMGVIYQAGKHGVEVDLGKAERCFERANDLGYEEAGLRLANLQETIRFEQDQNSSIESLSLSALKAKAEAGDAQAHFELGSIYYFGVEAEKDLDAGVAHLQVACEKGQPEAMNMLGQLHFHEQITTCDAETGFALLARAAQLKNGSAVEKLFEIEANAHDRYALWFELDARAALESETRATPVTGVLFDVVVLEQAKEDALPAPISSGKTAFMSFYASKAFEAPTKSPMEEDAANIERAVQRASYAPKM